MRGRPYNPVLYHQKRGLDYREMLKMCNPNVVKKIASHVSHGRAGVYLFGRTYAYGSSEHIALIEAAIRAKFAQNKPAIIALLATEGMELRYAPRLKDSTLFPSKRFCALLTAIREEGLAKRDAERAAYDNKHTGQSEDRGDE
jgi:hypothetical protein